MNKSISTIAALALLTTALATSASAFSFSPKNGNFAATGSITVTAGAVSLPCSATLMGKTKGDTATITSASFGGLSCAALSASNLPWSVTINNLHNIVFHGVSVNALVLGVCGPGNMPAIDSSRGKLTIAGAGLPGVIPCSVSGTFQTKPMLVVEKK